MPRPPTRRNRPTSKAASTTSKEKTQLSTTCDDMSTGNPSKSPSTSNQDEGIASQLSFNTQQGNTLRQLIRNQTPLAKTHEHAIESSPVGERGATGSRLPTRSRGYSSTLSMAGRKVDMSSNVPGTPAFESSILSNFRRRPRQASILQMMQAEDASSELDDDDFLGGLSPEDESTPLNLPRGKSLLARNSASQSPFQLSLPSDDGSRKRKRSVEEFQDPQSPSAVMENTPTKSPNPRDQVNGPCGSPESMRPLESLGAFSQTTAPPVSSSPPLSPAHPTTTLYPALPSNCIKAGARAYTDGTLEAITIPTATLQDRLLPRRRQQRRKHRDVGELGVSSDSSEDDCLADQDDDELSYLRPKRGTTGLKLKPYSGVWRGNEQRAVVLANKGNNRKRPSNIVKVTQEAQGNPDAITCSSLSHEDTNIDKMDELAVISSQLSSSLDSGEFESASPPSADFLSEELRSQWKKFIEIDKWEMEFEDIPGSQDSALD